MAMLLHFAKQGGLTHPHKTCYDKKLYRAYEEVSRSHEDGRPPILFIL
jgi:hypothetical protein